VLPEIREYERTATTALNAALSPVMGTYLDALASGVDDRGLPTPRIMASNGGLIAADAAAERPVETLLSGPAAGVRGAAYVGEEAGLTDLVTMDMGGTSCDVSVVRGGDPVVTTEATVGDHPAGDEEGLTHDHRRGERPVGAGRPPRGRVRDGDVGRVGGVGGGSGVLCPVVRPLARERFRRGRRLRRRWRPRPCRRPWLRSWRGFRRLLGWRRASGRHCDGEAREVLAAAHIDVSTCPVSSI